MKFRLVITRIVVTGVLLGILVAHIASQDMPQSSTALVVRKQMQDIADDVVAKLHVAPHNGIALSVESLHPVTLVQNAFVEALQRKGFEPFLRTGGDSVSTALTISVLNERVVFEDARGKSFLRTVESEVEARVEFGSLKLAEYLGTFQRSARDTVLVREPEYVLGAQGVVHDDDSSMMQRIIGPFIVLAASIVVVYLFFTVRS